MSSERSATTCLRGARGAVMFARASRRRATARGFTLVEMILAIVILGVGLAGVLLAFSVAVRGSADPVIHAQMRAIAEELIEEIELKPYSSSTAGSHTSCARDTYTSVADYNGYSTTSLGTVCSIDGNPIPALNGYTVSVSVTTSALDGIGAARRIVVTVAHGSETLQLVGYRTDWAS
jgi:MSHA pilin protein MshD